MKFIINDHVKTPDGRNGRVVEFNYDQEEGKLAKVSIMDIRGIIIASRWYLRSELKPV
jgi:hypothetical protein